MRAKSKQFDFQTMRAMRGRRNERVARNIVFRLDIYISQHQFEFGIWPQRTHRIARGYAGYSVLVANYAKDKCNATTYTYTLPSMELEDHCKELNMETYRIPADILEKLNLTLKLYEGTKNYHNFTSKKNLLDPSAKRFIMSLTSGEPFLSPQGIEFLTLKVKGQSFMLHQIRRMVGVAFFLPWSGVTEEATIARAFTEEQLDLPMAPGLVLDQVHYDRYGEDGIDEPLTWEELEPEIELFVEKYIYSNIYATEQKDKSMLDWLDTHGSFVRCKGKQGCDSSNVTGYY